MKSRKYNHLSHLALTRVQRPYKDDPPNPPPADPPVKTFTQEELNRILADERRKAETKIAKLQEDFKGGKMTEQERADYEERIAATRREFQTKEQQAAERLKAKESEAANKIKALEEEKKTLESLFTNELVSSSLGNAVNAAPVKPVNPNLITGQHGRGVNVSDPASYRELRKSGQHRTIGQ
jgi:hypothetical protein